MADPSAPTLHRGALGTGDIVFFVVSAAAPLMIMAGVAPYALLVGGLALQQLWLFWAAPLVGGVIGGVVYRMLFAERASRPDIAGEPSVREGAAAAT